MRFLDGGPDNELNSFYCTLLLDNEMILVAILNVKSNKITVELNPRIQTNVNNILSQLEIAQRVKVILWEIRRTSFVDRLCLNQFIIYDWLNVKVHTLGRSQYYKLRIKFYFKWSMCVRRKAKVSDQHHKSHLDLHQSESHPDAVSRSFSEW